MNDDREFDEVDLQKLRERVKALPTEIVANATSWTNIRDRIENSRVLAMPSAATAATNEVDVAPEIAKHATVNRFRAQRTVMLAAASLFIAVTATVVMRESGEPISDSARATDGTQVTGANVVDPNGDVAPSPGSTDTMLPVVRQMDPPVAAVLAQYNAATNDLAKDFEARRPRLQPEALAVIDSCLHTLDQAIRESRDALDEAPGNLTIIELLQVTYQQKLDLLRRTADLPTVSLQD